MLVTLLPSLFLSPIKNSRIYEQKSYYPYEKRMTSSIAEHVKLRRDLDQIRTAVQARRFSGLETLIMGLKLSAMALRVAGER